MDDGSYGTCERCGNAIATPRLEARPMSTHCVECAAVRS
jgi:RNA polymerase-binding transcription factor DksA